MAKYDVTYSCGHEGVVNIIGPVKDREWKREREESKMCPDCWRSYIEEERERKNREAAEKAAEMELPELTGSPKQIAWANTLRQQFIDLFDSLGDREIKHLCGYYEIKEEDITKLKHYILENKTQARYYIDSRHDRLMHHFDRELENALKPDDERAQEQADKELEEKIEEEMKAEATLYPENGLKTETVAQIKVDGNVIRVRFPEMVEEFRKTVRFELSMKWNGSEWEREILPRHGTVSDRAAEVGHTLLASGFIVRIEDPMVREKAISGDYKEECTRWILARISGNYEGWLVVSWKRPDDFYKAAKRISGSRYSRPHVVVPPQNFDEVLDFSEQYGFKISEGAQKVIDKAREEKEKSILVDAKKPSRDGIVADGKPQPLEVPEEVRIDEEFRDDN